MRVQVWQFCEENHYLHKYKFTESKKVFRIDRFHETCGHITVRLLHHMWSKWHGVSLGKIKQHVLPYNTSEDMTLRRLQKLMTESLKEHQQTGWHSANAFLRYKIKIRDKKCNNNV